METMGLACPELYSAKTKKTVSWSSSRRCHSTMEYYSQQWTRFRWSKGRQSDQFWISTLPATLLPLLLWLMVAVTPSEGAKLPEKSASSGFSSSSGASSGTVPEQYLTTRLKKKARNTVSYVNKGVQTAAVPAAISFNLSFRLAVAVLSFSRTIQLPPYISLIDCLLT
ncbi:hypothetical protein ElyMa_003008100 [Elysia marginata]|uniref:Uncharacterized protein n=1 Tax=Elysia marginata TaxID=1093978 RepID=A0AAV4ICE6_9GAST|nr:hypothetical protein ElyMa_003008100 [Elysia marginata]